MSSSEIHLPEPMNILDAFTKEPPEPDFVFPGLLSGTVGSIISPGGVGKSFIALEAAIAVATGCDITGGIFSSENQLTRKVLYLPAEDMSTIIQGRLHWLGKHLNSDAHKAACSSITIHSLVGKIPYIHTSSRDELDRKSAKAWASKLKELAEEHDLVIIDTLRRFHGCDENDGAAMTRLIQVLEEIAFETGTTFIFLHHTNKASLTINGDSQGAARGSGVLTDNGRWQLNLVVMSKKEANKKKVKECDRRNYIRIVQSKVNYSSSQEDIWLQRSEHGVLIPAKLKKKSTPNGQGIGRENDSNE